MNRVAHWSSEKKTPAHKYTKWRINKWMNDNRTKRSLQNGILKCFDPFVVIFEFLASLAQKPMVHNVYSTKTEEKKRKQQHNKKTKKKHKKN